MTTRVLPQWFREHRIEPGRSGPTRIFSICRSSPVQTSGPTSRRSRRSSSSGALRGGYLHHSRDERHQRDPKSFFLTWEDWQRFAEKYARAFVSQGFGRGDGS